MPFYSENRASVGGQGEVEEAETHVEEIDEPVSFDSNRPYISVKTLPSGFLPYPKDVSIAYRTYGYGEILQLNQSKITLEELYTQFYLPGIECSNIDKRDLTLSDASWIIFLRKLSTLGDKNFVVKYPCSSCGSVQSFTSTLFKDVEFADMNDEVQELPIEADFSNGETLQFWPLTVGGFLEAPDLDKITLLAKCVMNKSFEDAYNFIQYEANMEDGNILEEIDRLLYHGMKPIHHSCENCGHENSVSVRRRDTLIYPFRESGESYKDKIRFGSKTRVRS